MTAIVVDGAAPKWPEAEVVTVKRLTTGDTILVFSHNSTALVPISRNHSAAQRRTAFPVTVTRVRRITEVVSGKNYGSIVVSTSAGSMSGLPGNVTALRIPPAATESGVNQ